MPIVARQRRHECRHHRRPQRHHDHARQLRMKALKFDVAFGFLDGCDVAAPGIVGAP
jgi:hypothetical protein